MRVVDHDGDGSWGWWIMMPMDHEGDGSWCRWIMRVMDLESDGSWGVWIMRSIDPESDNKLSHVNLVRLQMQIFWLQNKCRQLPTLWSEKLFSRRRNILLYTSCFPEYDLPFRETYMFLSYYTSGQRPIADASYMIHHCNKTYAALLSIMLLAIFQEFNNHCLLL